MFGLGNRTRESARPAAVRSVGMTAGEPCAAGPRSPHGPGALPADAALGPVPAGAQRSPARSVRTRITPTGPDLATTKSDATLGTDCYNVSTVKLDASNVGADASIVSLDLDSLTADIGTATQDIATMKNDLAILSASGRPATAGATAAIAAVGKAIRQAVAKANGEIDQVNADVTHAYSVANGMATGSCSRDGPGHPPAPIRHIASK